MKAATLVESPDHLERLNQKLLEIDAVGLWHEPLDLDDRISAFMDNIKGLLLEKAAQTPSGSEEDMKMLSSAISCLFGVAVLSGSFDLICKALEVISVFDKAAPEALSGQGFDACAP